MNGAIELHLIDDDEAVLDSLSQFLESKHLVVHRHLRAEPVVELLAEPAERMCIVSDVRMPGMSGLDLQKEIMKRGIDIPLILITGHGDIEMAVTAVKAGAHDFLEKPFDEQRLLESIEDAVAGAQKKHHLAQEKCDLAARRAEMSERQRQVMDLAVMGRTNKEIGAELGISPRTVEIYRARVMERMGAATFSELVRMAVQLGRFNQN